jgi:hypothetical protein
LARNRNIVNLADFGRALFDLNHILGVLVLLTVAFPPGQLKKRPPLAATRVPWGYGASPPA